MNTTNQFSQTPLYECVQINRWDMVEMLLQRGADLSIQDQNGEDIFEHLADNGEHAKAERLRELSQRIAPDSGSA